MLRVPPLTAPSAVPLRASCSLPAPPAPPAPPPPLVSAVPQAAITSAAQAAVAISDALVLLIDSPSSPRWTVPAGRSPSRHGDARVHVEERLVGFGHRRNPVSG